LAATRLDAKDDSSHGVHPSPGASHCVTPLAPDPVEPEPPLPSSETIPDRPAIRLATPGYRTIDEIPPSAILELLMDSLRQFGSTEVGDLTKEVARQLGFKRTGDRIKQKIGEDVESLIREGKIGREDGRLQVAAPKVNVS
jgi:hypothetical protein